MSETPGKFLPLEERLPILAGGGWHAVLRTVVENLMGLPEIRRMADCLGEQVARGAHPYEVLFKLMEFELEARGVVEAVPSAGPLVVIANHPLGGPEALGLALAAMRARPDVKVLGNVEVMRLPGFADWTLPLEIFGGEGAARNFGVLKQALAHLRGGGALVVFPAGAVSHWQWERARVEDPPWPLHTARMIRLSGAQVLPVRVFGRNGPLFQILGAMHPLVRSALIPRAFLAMRGGPVCCRAGKPLKAAELPPDPKEMSDVLRAAIDRVCPEDGN